MQHRDDEELGMLRACTCTVQDTHNKDRRVYMLLREENHKSTTRDKENSVTVPHQLNVNIYK